MSHRANFEARSLHSLNRPRKGQNQDLCPLPDRLKQADASGHRDIEAADRTSHGQLDQMIADARGSERRSPCAFSAHNQRHGTR